MHSNHLTPMCPSCFSHTVEVLDVHPQTEDEKMVMATLHCEDCLNLWRDRVNLNLCREKLDRSL